VLGTWSPGSFWMDIAAIDLLRQHYFACLGGPGLLGTCVIHALPLPINRLTEDGQRLPKSAVRMEADPQ